MTPFESLSSYERVIDIVALSASILHSSNMRIWKRHSLLLGVHQVLERHVVLGLQGAVRAQRRRVRDLVSGRHSQVGHELHRCAALCLLWMSVSLMRQRQYSFIVHLHSNSTIYLDLPTHFRRFFAHFLTVFGCRLIASIYTYPKQPARRHALRARTMPSRARFRVSRALPGSFCSATDACSSARPRMGAREV